MSIFFYELVRHIHLFTLIHALSFFLVLSGNSMSVSYSTWLFYLLLLSSLVLNYSFVIEIKIGLTFTKTKKPAFSTEIIFVRIVEKTVWMIHRFDTSCAMLIIIAETMVSSFSV
jgi:hypothetical protein